MVKETKSNIDDARRQGQFEGQVLTTLAEIKTSIAGLTGNYNGLEGRVRVVETGFAQLTDLMAKLNEFAQEKVKESEKIHTNYDAANAGMEKRVRKLEDWKIWMMATAGAVAAAVDLILRAAPAIIKSFN